MNYGFNYPSYYSAYQPQSAPQSNFSMQGINNPIPNNGVRLVASKAEVVAAQIPFDSNEYYFKDTSNGKIYVKAFNPMDGTAPIVTYSREAETPVQYATAEDIKALKAEIEELKRGQVNAEA